MPLNSQFSGESGCKKHDQTWLPPWTKMVKTLAATVVKSDEMTRQGKQNSYFDNGQWPRQIKRNSLKSNVVEFPDHPLWSTQIVTKQNPSNIIKLYSGMLLGVPRGAVDSEMLEGALGSPDTLAKQTNLSIWLNELVVECSLFWQNGRVLFHFPIPQTVVFTCLHYEKCLCWTCLPLPPGICPMVQSAMARGLQLKCTSLSSQHWKNWKLNSLVFAFFNRIVAMRTKLWQSYESKASHVGL